MSRSARHDDDFASGLLAAGRSERPHPATRRRAIAAITGVGTAALGAASVCASSTAAASVSGSSSSGVASFAAEAANTTAGTVTDALVPSFFKVAASPFAIAAAKIVVVSGIVLAPPPPTETPPSTSVVAARIEAREPASAIDRRDVAPDHALSSAGPSRDVPSSEDRTAEAPARPNEEVPHERRVRPTESPGSRATAARTTASALVPSSTSSSASSSTTPAVEALRSTERDDALLVEVARLEAARRALDSGDVDGAAKIVGTDALPSSGELAAEREVMAIEVLVREGRVDAARARAASFAARFGEGRLASRVVRLVAPR